jgi:hypothetical protein
LRKTYTNAWCDMLVVFLCFASSLAVLLSFSQVVQATEGVQQSSSAFVSKKTGVTVQNSLAYLDHIHGKKYQRAMGMSMRVKAAELSEVQSRLAKLAAAKKASKGGGSSRGVKGSAPVRPELVEKMKAFNSSVQTQQDARKRAREGEEAGGGSTTSTAAATKAPRQGSNPARESAQTAPQTEEEVELAALQAMMGFGGFAEGSNG